MTSGEGRHPFTVAAWILVVALVVAGVVAVVGDILSASLVVDAVAMWPIFLLVIVAGLLGWWRGRRGGNRAGAIIPLSLFTALVIVVAVHLGGWEQLPSAETSLSGPEASELSPVTELTAQIVGELELSAATGGRAYTVDPIMRGGLVGVPEAVETSVDGDVSIELAAADAPGWYTFSGWEVGLSPEITWRLVLNGGIDADLVDVPVEAVAAGGSGLIELGPAPEGGGRVVVSGDFTITVPPSVPVEASGAVSAPEAWETTPDGARSPGGDGPRWVIRAEGDIDVRVVER